ncbi:MAG TPA: hypothetical protein VF628_00470 [Allosphingosinicella sp.]|jgi:hypothetical protein
MRSLAALLLLSGCAAGQGVDEERGAANLARDLASRVAGEPRTCVPADAGQNLVVVDRTTLTLERGGAIWVNRLASECPGLRPFDTLIIEVRGNEYCRGDRFRSVVPGQSIPGAVCVLGAFTPYRKPR